MIKEKYFEIFQSRWNLFHSVLLLKTLSFEAAVHKSATKNWSEKLAKGARKTASL